MNPVGKSLFKDLAALVIITVGLLLLLSRDSSWDAVFGFAWPLLLLMPGAVMLFETLSYPQAQNRRLQLLGEVLIGFAILQFVDIFSAHSLHQYLFGSVVLLAGMLLYFDRYASRSVSVLTTMIGLVLIISQLPIRLYVLPTLVILLGLLLLKPRSSR